MRLVKCIKANDKGHAEVGPLLQERHHRGDAFVYSQQHK